MTITIVLAATNASRANVRNPRVIFICYSVVDLCR
jgi:hypothetical protein